ncbi:hypothetical protein QWY92_08005 [Algibacter miyuki]|nr:hypothetical protein [Algibacter miyuki]MDN3665353.1 hypothetical protein [Algibacter miyuki]
MTLQEGQYVVNVELNITTSETNTGSIGNVNEEHTFIFTPPNYLMGVVQ